MDGHQFTAYFEAPGGKPILHAYPDPETGAEPWTIGLGHTGPEVHKDTVWTEDQCWHAFYNDYAVASGHAPHIIGVSTFAGLNDPRKAVIIDMCFNPGPTRLSGFVHMIDAIQRGKWNAAQSELLASKYASQVKTRADMNAAVLLTGKWPEDMALS